MHTYTHAVAQATAATMTTAIATTIAAVTASVVVFSVAGTCMHTHVCMCV